jgi:hypothetical protein
MAVGWVGSARATGTATGVVVALLAVGGCGTLGLDGPVRVRVENSSTVELDQVMLSTFDGVRTFEDLSPGEASRYVEVSKAYRMATVRVVVGVDTLSLTVIDYVGETPLDGGRYTYLLGLVPGGGPGEWSLTQSFRED